MSFEKPDLRRLEHEKQEKKEQEEEKTERFLLEKKILRESQDLLNNLASEISDDFWVTLEEAKKMIAEHASENLDGLKEKISWNPDTVDLEKLESAVLKAREKIGESSAEHLDELKNLLEGEELKPEEHIYRVSRTIIPVKIRKRAYNPQNIWDQMIWASVGLLDSSEAILLFLYGLGKWILLTPYHLYLYIIEKKENEESSDL